MRASIFLEQVGQDLRYALRAVRVRRSFTFLAVLTLALGIGATTAIFSMVNTLMLRLLPVRRPEQLVELLSRYPGEPRLNTFDWSVYEHFRDHNQVFVDLIGVSPVRFAVTSERIETEVVDGEYVTGNVFSALGVTPAFGRLIEPGDDRVGSPDAAVAVVSWSYWNGRLNRDPAAVGMRLLVDGAPVTIVGVAPREYLGLQLGARPAIWLPAAAEAINHKPSRRVEGTLQMKLMGRLKPGITIDRAHADLAVLDRWRVEYLIEKQRAPMLRDLRIELASAGAGFAVLRDAYGTPLLVLAALAGVVLIIACSNVASMLLARSMARRREMAVRMALGSSRLRLLRQMVVESLLLSAMATVFGVLLGYAVVRALVGIIRSGRGLIGLPGPLHIEVMPDVHVLMFAAGIAVVTAVAFGTVPAWTTFVSVPATALREIGRLSETRVWRLFAKVLVVAQVALSVVLLSAALLFAMHLSTVRNVDLGFRRGSVLLVTLDASESGQEPSQLALAYEELLKRVQTIAGVRSATLAAVTPIEGPGAARFVNVEGVPEPAEQRRYMSLNWVAPRYFETFGMQWIAGRDFAFEDATRTPVAIVNEAVARRYFGNRSPLGRRFTFDGQDRSYEIVGVVGDAKYRDLRLAAPPTIYLNAFQEGRGTFSKFALRTDVPPSGVAGEVRRVARDALETVRVARVTTLSDQVDASLVPERLVAALSSLFGVLGAALAAIGLYGLLTYTVTRRVHEIGIRMALGAPASEVTRMVLTGALVMVGVGLLVGAPIAVLGKRFLAPFADQLPATMVMPLMLAAVVIVTGALVAAYGPARRAARVDPMRALREE